MTKKLIFLLGIIFLNIGFVYGQKLQFGIRGDLDIASQSIDDPTVLATNSVTTFSMHVFGRYELKSPFYLQAGLGISGKGATSYSNTQTSTDKLTYIDIPVNLIYKVKLPKLGNIYLGAGPFLSYGLSGNQVVESSGNNPGFKLKFGNDGDYKSLEEGVNFTGGVELNNHLTFNLNYELGINNLATGLQIESGTLSIKNRTFGVGLGLLF